MIVAGGYCLDRGCCGLEVRCVDRVEGEGFDLCGRWHRVKLKLNHTAAPERSPGVVLLHLWRFQKSWHTFGGV